MRVKDFIAGCLVSMFVILLIYAPISQTQTQKQYDPWADMDDDGYIGIDHFGAEGEPINKTALLYNINETFTELLAKIDALNSTVRNNQAQIAELQVKVNELLIRMAELNATVAEFQTRIDYLEQNVSNLYEKRPFVIVFGGGEYPIHWFGTVPTNWAVIWQDQFSLNCTAYIFPIFVGTIFIDSGASSVYSVEMALRLEIDGQCTTTIDSRFRINVKSPMGISFPGALPGTYLKLQEGEHTVCIKAITSSTTALDGEIEGTIYIFVFPPL